MFYCLSNFNATFLRPLMLSSDNELTRQNEISYIEGSSFTQKSFSSSRKQDTVGLHCTDLLMVLSSI